MNPISLGNSFYASPYAANMRPESLMRKSADSSAGGVTDELGSIPLSSGTQAQAPAGFDNLLGNMVKDVNAKQAAASDAVTGVLSGQNVPLHQAMISMEEASVSFQLMVEVRNKLLEGYQELMRLQV